MNIHFRSISVNLNKLMWTLFIWDLVLYVNAFAIQYALHFWKFFCIICLLKMYWIMNIHTFTLYYQQQKKKCVKRRWNFMCLIWHAWVFFFILYVSYIIIFWTLLSVGDFFFIINNDEKRLLRVTNHIHLHVVHVVKLVRGFIIIIYTWF